MTMPTAVIDNLDAETRWRDWLARGDASDRRTAVRMRSLLLLIVSALVIWLIVELG